MCAADIRTKGETLQANLVNAATSNKRFCAPHGAKRGKFRSSIVWPLVVLGLIYVTTDSASPYVWTSRGSFLDAPNEQSLNERVCQADARLKRVSTAQICSAYNPDSCQEILNTNLRLVEPPQGIQCTDYVTNLCSSPLEQCSSSKSLLSSALLTYLPHQAYEAVTSIYALLSQIPACLGPKVLFADAAQFASNSMYQTKQDREIIVLNSTNFNAELIQHDHPFPHIKLVEYYLEYCGICLRFKPTYVQLSKDIYTWRNVIRASAIDLGVSSNTWLASSWSIDVIPTLRIHPPPSSTLSMQLNKQLLALDPKSYDQLKSISDTYNAAKLMVNTLGVTKYIQDARKENLPEKVAALKIELARYIERYVSQHPGDLPSTWPNLRPVEEERLIELRRNHPRQELFLLLEAGGKNDPNGLADPSSSAQPSLSLQIMLELSSSAAAKAIRYVRAGDNKALLEDVIAHMRREPSEQVTDGQQSDFMPNKQIDLLQKLQENTPPDQHNHIILIHIDDSRSPYGHSSGTPANKFPSITVVTGSDLVKTEEQYASLDGSSNISQSKRDVLNQLGGRTRRSLSDDLAKMSSDRKLNLIAHYINQTYIEIQEDREFLEALRSFDENPTAPHMKREAVRKFQATHQENQISLSHNIRKSNQEDLEKKSNSSRWQQFLSRLNPAGSNSFFSSTIKCHQDEQDDYEDKLKAIRYIFFQEVPRKTLDDKSPAEKLEKLTTLINLASVIKVYFPLPDMASVQFIDGILTYLNKQQTLLAASMNDQQERASSSGGSSFDFRALKLVIKNLEAEGKRLPEIKDWQHCKFSGYPCALWRLFHTLTAFEYKKLSQISQLSQSTSRQVSKPEQNSTVVPLAVESHPAVSEQHKTGNDAKPVPTASDGNSNNGLPVERLVSPPSTTTSLALTIVTPITAQDHQQASLDNQNSNNNRKQLSEAELPEPVLLVMRDYVTNFFSCEECARNFRQEAVDLTFEKIRRQEPAEFSVLWLWETHNRVSKRLSISPDTNPPEHPKKWYPPFELCPKCYNRPPSYLKDTNLELPAIFHESIDWNREEILSFLMNEFTRQPMDAGSNLFGYPVPHGFNYIIVIGICSILLIILLRCASCYIERQRRHKASLLNGNGAHYSVELQSH